MISNGNNLIVKKIAWKNLKAARNRNIITVIAICLTTVLFATIFTMGFGLIETIQKENIRKAGGAGHVVINLISDDIYGKLKDSPLIKEIAYTKTAADEIKNAGLDKWRTEMWYMDETAVKFAGYSLEEGRYPEKENDIMVDTKTLQCMGYSAKVGEKISITMRIKDKIVNRDFVLSGYWKTGVIDGVGRIIVSGAYEKAHREELTYTYKPDLSSLDYSGCVTAYVNFKNTKGLEDKTTQLLGDAGYVWDGSPAEKGAPNYISARISPAYASMLEIDDPQVIMALAGAVILIMITGYLIIYNIYQISVVQDIRIYGQYKTLGTTKKQLKGIMKRQICTLSWIGIPLGVLLGYVIGNLLVPVLMNTTGYKGAEKIAMSFNPLIFIGAAIFSFLTVSISARKPVKIAASVSPLEALRYTDGTGNLKRRRKRRHRHGKLIYRMAFANLGRNRKRTILVILSLSLSLVLINTVFTLSKGFDIEKYVEKFVDKDFVISSADYFTYKFEKSQTVLSGEFVEYVKKQPEFGEGGRLATTKLLKERFYADSTALSSANRDQEGHPLISLYGTDDYLLDSMELLEGTTDSDKLKAGNGVIMGVIDDGTGKPEENVTIQIGDEITFCHFDVDSEKAVEQKFQIAAKVVVKESSYTTRQTGETNFYLPMEIFENLAEYPVTVSFPFDCREEENAVSNMEARLQNYIKTTDNKMGYDSKQVYVEEFKGVKRTVLTIGSALGIIVSFIGIMNFINALITSVLTRKREFAIMQSIGMTGKQLKGMLYVEGLGYALGTIVVSLILGILFSVTVIQQICGGIWFFSYRFTILPILFISPILVMLTLFIPHLIYGKTVTNSIIERLKTD